MTILTQASASIADQTDLFQEDAAQGAEIDFSVKGGRICRTIKYNDKVLRSHISAGGKNLALGSGGCIASNFDKAWLASARQWPKGGEDFGVLNTVDLFSGCGGFTLGLHQAIQALGLTPNVQLAADIDETSAQVYERNFSPCSFIREGVETVFD